MTAAPGTTSAVVPDADRDSRAARRWGLGLLAAFLVLAVPVVLRWPPLVSRDLAVDVAAHAVVLREHVLLAVAVAVTNAGSPVSVSIITALLVLGSMYRRRIGAAVYLAAARLVELGAETAVKHLVGRPRPAWTDPVAHASSFSFPSGHTAGTAVLCTSLLVLASPAWRRRRVPAGGSVTPVARVALGALAILAVAASRVLLGVHYPSDVLGGALLGTACALLLRPVPAVVDRRLKPAPAPGS